jgi:cysteinyl-tRNA synthetase
MERKWALFISVLVLTAGCLVDPDDNNKDNVPSDPREAMRDLVSNISSYSKGIDPDFMIVTQNGNDLAFDGGNVAFPDVNYLHAIDGVGQEDLFYGYENDNEPTPQGERDLLLELLRGIRDQNKTVLVTDYCSDVPKMDDSYEKNLNECFISFAADRRDLDGIPAHPTPPHRSNSEEVQTLSSAKNFLYLIDPEQYSDRDSYLNDLRGTSYDLLIIDLFFHGIALTPSEVDTLKVKQGGGSRLVLCYMSIGEAEDYRYYWQEDWKEDPPAWLDEENPDWDGNYKVRYWDPEWQRIIMGKDGAYVDRVLSAGFDGVYLDIIDAFEYYE